MKRIYTIIILLITLLTSASAYQYRGLGITARERAVINGYTPGNIQEVNTPSQVRTIYSVHMSATYRPGQVQHYGMTYSNGTVTGGRTTNQPRKVTVYNGSGETGQTPGGNSDSSDWLYMQDADGNWYCSKDGGITWYKWEEKDYGSGIWSILQQIWDIATGNTEAWSTTPTTPPEDSSHWASDPNDPFLTPIDNNYSVLFLLALGLGYMVIKRKKYKKYQNNLIDQKNCCIFASDLITRYSY